MFWHHGICGSAVPITIVMGLCRCEYKQTAFFTSKVPPFWWVQVLCQRLWIVLRNDTNFVNPGTGHAAKYKIDAAVSTGNRSAAVARFFVSSFMRALDPPAKINPIALITCHLPLSKFRHLLRCYPGNLQGCLTRYGSVFTDGNAIRNHGFSPIVTKLKA